MRLLVSVKRVGGKKPVIGRRPLDVGVPGNLRELLTDIVTRQVAAWNARRTDDPGGDATRTVTLLQALSAEAIAAGAEAGKVTFSLRYGGRNQPPGEAVDNALLAFTDGLYRVFVNDSEVTDLDAPLPLKDGDALTFIRLTMLAGNIW